eukprot:2649594-Pleurochrysis_carterae.AAC.4
MTEYDATLFATEILSHDYLDCGHVAKDKSGKPVCPSAAVKPRRSSDFYVSPTALAPLSPAATLEAALALFFFVKVLISSWDPLTTSPSSKQTLQAFKVQV